MADENVGLEDHSVLELLRSLTWKDLMFLIGLCSLVFGGGIFFDKHFGEMGATAKSKIGSLESTVSELQSKNQSLQLEVRSLSSENTSALEKANQAKIHLRNYRQCLSSLTTKLKTQIETERERLVAAAGTFANREIREQVLTDWDSSIKPQTDQNLATLGESLSGEGGTCVYRTAH